MYPEYICENLTWARELSEFFSKVDKEKYPNSKEEYRFTRLLNFKLDIKAKKGYRKNKIKNKIKRGLNEETTSMLK